MDQGLKMKKILITSGPTRMSLDAMRFISNRSTGRFGTLMAEEALKKGARVTFIYGVGSETPKPHPRLKLIEIETNRDVADALKRELRHHYNVCIHAMAVLDFQPVLVRKGKTKTKNGIWNLCLVPTPKIINQIKKWSPKILLVGFKLEVGVSQSTLLKSARNLLRQTKADLVLANQLTEGKDANHPGYLLDSEGSILARARGKQNLARLIIKVIKKSGLHHKV
ncbi:MAG: hypothetical protein HY877_01410 [Deltaproteobacteria bacterium]|nr:hypothetical protein [Deltaproteobacteria bacterium]